MGRRLTVVPCARVPRAGRSRLWAFGYADLAALLGRSEDMVRQMVAGGKKWRGRRLDPRDLRAVCEAWAARARAHG